MQKKTNPSHYISRHKKELSCDRHWSAVVGQKERSVERKKELTQEKKDAGGGLACAPFFLLPILLYCKRVSCLLRLLHRLCQLEGRPVPIQYKKEKSVYHLVKIHAKKKHQIVNGPFRMRVLSQHIPAKKEKWRPLFFSRRGEGGVGCGYTWAGGLVQLFQRIN